MLSVHSHCGVAKPGDAAHQGDDTKADNMAVDLENSHPSILTARTLVGMNIESLNLTQDADLADKVRAGAEQARRADGIAPLSEQFLLGLSDARLEHQHYLAKEGEQVVGIAAVAGQDVELFVHPSQRGHGLGQDLIEHVRAAQPHAHFWAHGNLPAARALAARNNLHLVRQLLVMEVNGQNLAKHAALDDAPFTHLSYTDSVQRWGKDWVEQEWVRANNEAFSWHPEQGGWDLERLHRGMEADWFDPADVQFMWDEEKTSPQGAPTMVGFHWTKWHTEETPEFGEVYVIGLSEAYRGQKLGGPLLHDGLHRMVEKGAERVILYVEADNEPAVRAYERLGFEVIEDHSVYSDRD